eukprot:UN25200
MDNELSNKERKLKRMETEVEMKYNLADSLPSDGGTPRATSPQMVKQKEELDKTAKQVEEEKKKLLEEQEKAAKTTKEQSNKIAKEKNELEEKRLEVQDELKN